MSRPRFRFKTGSAHFTANIAKDAIKIETVTANATNSKPVAPHQGHAGLDGTIDSVKVKWNTAAVHSVMVGFLSGSTNATTVADNQLIDYLTFATFVTFDGQPNVSIRNGLAIPVNDASGGKEFHLAIYAYTTALALSTGALAVEWTYRGEAGGGR
ncbi:MAG: hypothetical protein ACE5FA_00330 [Dehalococcoidia bacterium]